VVKVRDGHQVRNKAAHIAVGVDLDGVKHVLGIWVQAAEGARFWAGVCAELRNRGVRDVLIVCCDGLSGFPEATWPAATVAPFRRESAAGAAAGVRAADRLAAVFGVGDVLASQFAVGVEPPGALDEPLRHRRLVVADNLIEPSAAGSPRGLPDLG
jgi:hypothetical protein